MNPIQTTLHIAPDGHDDASGLTPDAPLASLEAARDRLRTMRQTGSLVGTATVLLRGGDYPREQTFALNAADSGTPEAPVVYRSYPGERARLLGGRLLETFAAVTDEAILARVAPAAHDHLLQCDLSALCIEDFGQLSSRGFSRPTTAAHLELFFAGKRMEIARWPNRDWTHIDRPAAPQEDEHGGEQGDLTAGFFYAGDRPSRWQHLDDIWLHGYWAWDWANSYEALASWDLQTGLIRTQAPHGLYGFRQGQRFYFLNILEELDQPGEYYLDHGNGQLYFWPPGPIAAAEIAVSTLAGPLLSLHQTSHVRFADLTLAYGRGSGVEISGGTDTALSGCAISQMGNHGINIEAGSGHAAIGCDLSRLGDSGIRLSGGDRATLAKANHQAENNHIAHFGEWSRCYQPAIKIAGVGHRVRHNLIHDGPHNAIQLAGNEHILEYNHIHHVCRESGDVGAFYMGRDWTERGNILRHNFIHDTGGVGMGSMGVYLDDCASGTTLVGNIFCRCTRAIFIGGGRNNRVENNIFVDCAPAIQIDGRGLDDKPVWRQMVDQTMRARLDAVDHHAPPYRTRYPDLKELDRYYAAGVGIPPEGNLVVRNICRGGEWLDIGWHAKPSMVAIQYNMTDEDPLFVDEEAMDFQLRIDSPAYEQGFKRIPVDKIGLYLDEHRSALAPAHGGTKWEHHG